GSGNGNDGWTTANEDGLTTAIAAVNQANAGGQQISWMGKPYVGQEGVRRSTDYDKYIMQSITQGATVIVTASSVGAQEALKAAPQYAGDGGAGSVKFIIAGGTSNGANDNVGSYNADTDPAWYVAGRFAGRVANVGHKCVGLVLPSPTKQLVRETNAFTLGV